MALPKKGKRKARRLMPENLKDIPPKYGRITGSGDHYGKDLDDKTSFINHDGKGMVIVKGERYGVEVYPDGYVMYPNDPGLPDATEKAVRAELKKIGVPKVMSLEEQRAVVAKRVAEQEARWEKVRQRAASKEDRQSEARAEIDPDVDTEEGKAACQAVTATRRGKRRTTAPPPSHLKMQSGKSARSPQPSRRKAPAPAEIRRFQRGKRR